MINPKKELFKWGPIDGKPIYIDYFMRPMSNFKGYLSAGWPDIMTYVSKDKIICIAEDEKLRDNGEILFRNHVLNEGELNRIYKEWLRVIDDLVNIQDNITKEKLKILNDKKFRKIFFEWNNSYLKFWVPSFLFEIGNWGGERILKNKLTNKKNFIELFEILSAPEALSFYQKEELELLKLKLISKELFFKKIREHRNKYFWIHNSYAGSKVLSVDFFKKRLSNISLEEAEKRIHEIQLLPEKSVEKKQKIVKKYKIVKEILNIAKKLSFCIWVQDYRKQYIFRAIYYIDLFLKEIERRYKICFNELCYYTIDDVTALLKKNIRIDNIEERYNGFLEYYFEKGKFKYYDGKKARKIIAPCLEIKIDKDIKEFKGIVVSRGSAKGRVKILLSPKNLNKMNKGDILVAPMTSPDYIVAMKKAAAIITDEGGITSHAAIVSRELKKPCIVGTRIATRVLKDGDLVGVDANNGIIRVLEK